MNLEQKYSELGKILSSLGKVVIAYSGGVDSTFLLKAALDFLGKDKVLACIAAGPSLPKNQYEQAVQLAKDLGAQLRTVKPEEMKDPLFTQNLPDRCFHCKSHLFEALLKLAKDEKFDAVIYGNNFDDRSDFRPGSKAAKKFGVSAPLMDAGLTKTEIRQLSKRMGLPTADLPASPCLASRIPYGLDVTAEKLLQIETAEDFLRTLGLVEFRVRHHGNIARIEAKKKQFDILLDNAEKIVEFVKSLGFDYVCFDLAGFRSGSLNEPLTDAQKLQNL